MTWKGRPCSAHHFPSQSGILSATKRQCTSDHNLVLGTVTAWLVLASNTAKVNSKDGVLGLETLIGMKQNATETPAERNSRLQKQRLQKQASHQRLGQQCE